MIEVPVADEEASSPLQGRREGRIEIVTRNRPAQRKISAIENDPDVGALVLVGAGAGFCAGSDLGGLAAMDTAARRGFEAASGPPLKGPSGCGHCCQSKTMPWVV